MVTRPAVPPYSSTAIAMCTRWDCRSRSRSSTSLESGTNVAARIRESIRSVVSDSRCSKTRLTTSLR